MTILVICIIILKECPGGLCNGGYLYTGEQLNKLIRDQSKNTVKIAIKELYDIYKDNWDQIILSELEDQFTENTYNKLKWLITKELNLLKRWVNDISLVYKKPCKREAVIENEIENEDTQEIEVKKVKDKNYEIMKKQTNKKDVVMQLCNRYTNLMNHVLLKIVYRNNKIDYDVLFFDNCEIYCDPEDWSRIIAIKYYKGMQLPVEYSKYAESSTSSATMSSDDRFKSQYGTPIHKFKESVIYALNDTKEIINEQEIKYTKGYIYTFKQAGEEEILVKTEPIPYTDENGNAILPFVLFSKEMPVNQLLDFSTGNDLRDANINIAINLIHLNSLMKYQSYKQLYMSVDDRTKVPEKLKTDPATVIILENGETASTIGTLDLQAAIYEIWKYIKERITTVLAQQGIAPQNFELSGTPQSGFALKINNIGKLEAREFQLPMYSEYEDQIFVIERIIWNYHNTGQKIDIQTKLVKDFGEIEFPMSPMEKQQLFNFEKLNNAKTSIDLIMDNNPDLTRKQAEEEFFKNKQFNDANIPAVTVSPFQQPGQVKPDEKKPKNKEKELIKA